MTLTNGVLTVAGEVDAVSLDISGNADIDGTLETDALSIDGTTITSTAAEINILDGDNSASTVTIVDADRIILNDGGTMKQVAVSALNTYTSSSIAADDIGTGDAAITIATSSGNITIDAQAGDADIIFKGTDSSSDITALTLDMSEAGAATFNNKIVATELDIPKELSDLITVLEFTLPTSSEIKKELLRLFESLNNDIDPKFLEILIRACQGLSIEKIRRVLSKSIAQYGSINNATVNLILIEKRQIITILIEYFRI